MKLQLLISTMNRKDVRFLDKMKVTSDAIVINQTDQFAHKKLTRKSNKIELYSFNEKGVGLSRNNALLRATADVVLLADDDVVYEDGYEQRVLDAFKHYPDADILFFNLHSTNPDRPEYEIKKPGRVRLHNALRYGAFRIAFRPKAVIKKGITFSLEFGGGARYMSGEDSLFIYDALKSGLKAYALPISLGVVNHETSTWFVGHTERFFTDKGALFAAMSPRLAPLFGAYFVLRNYKNFDTTLSRLDVLRLVFKGARDYAKEK